MSGAPATPWRLPCPWCAFYVQVAARGARGSDPGAGVQAAEVMRAHVEERHNETWQSFLAAPEKESA